MYRKTFPSIKINSKIYIPFLDTELTHENIDNLPNYSRIKRRNSFNGEERYVPLMGKKPKHDSLRMTQGHYIEEGTQEEEKDVDASRYMQTETNK
jgi:hypothetical protein